jgi:hypothetical protein
VSSRLMTILQTVAFPFRHCTVVGTLDGIEPPSARSERAVLARTIGNKLVDCRVIETRPPVCKTSVPRYH